jgi:hypothetical protein
MGAWDVTAFGNDDASDMVLELLEQSNPREFLSQILDQAKETGYLEAPEGSRMVAAAAIVAAARKRESITIPDNLASWIQANESILKPLAPAALSAIGRIRGSQSELCELWQETDEFSAWTGNLDVISTTLR